MTRAEFGEHILRRVNGYWPHSPLPKDTMALMFETLKDLPIDQALAALESLYRDGKEFAPTGGMILKRVTELGFDAPDWSQASGELKKCLSFGERVFRAGQERNERQERLERCHPSVQAFVEHVGWGQIEGWDSAEPAQEAQLRNKWQAFVNRSVEDRTLTGLPSGGLRRLERVNGPRHLSEALKALEQAR